MNSWQVPSMMHLSSTVCSNPNMKDNFDATCNFLSGEVAALQTLNASTTGTNRTVAAMSTEFSLESDDKTKSKSKPLGKRKGKSNDKSNDNPKKKSKKSKFPKKANKFDKDKPGAYVTTDVWRSMTKEQQQAAREQRRQQGIPTRNVSTVSSQKTTTFADTVEGRHYDNAQPARGIAKTTTVQVATLEQIQPTQKPKVYKGKATKETQMDPQAEIEFLKKRLDELSERI
jgi:hypothetical protein